MATYLVKVREVYEGTMAVEADSEETAIEEILAGEGEYIEGWLAGEYIEVEDWEVEEEE